MVHHEICKLCYCIHWSMIIIIPCSTFSLLFLAIGPSLNQNEALSLSRVWHSFSAAASHVMTLPRVLTPAAVASLAQTQQFQNAVILQYNTYLSMCHRFNRKSSNRRERKMYLGIDYKQRWLYYSGYYSPSWSIGKGNTNCWKVEKSVDLWTTLQQLHTICCKQWRIRIRWWPWHCWRRRRFQSINQNS